MIVCISGTPGTGKTTFANALSKKINARYVDVNKIIKEKKLSEGHDNKMKCNIVDAKKLNNALIELIKKAKKSESSLVIDSHLAHYLPKEYVDFCIIMKCSLKKLKKRLERKGYNAKKVRENLDCEIFDICFDEAKEEGHNVIEVDTGKKLAETLKETLKRLKCL